MSQRVTTETEMKDVSVLREAAKAIDVPLTENGDRVAFGGKWAGPTVAGVQYGSGIDVKSGELYYDREFFKPETFNPLKQAYASAKYQIECMRQGVQIESKETDANGNVILMCSLA
jgi:hypothetical protein